MRRLFLLATLLLPIMCNAGDIAFGTIKAIKVYGFGDFKHTAIIFNADATRVNDSCKIANLASANIPLYSGTIVNPLASHFMSVALAAKATGKKVRAYSSSSANPCDLDFLAMQEEYF